MSYLYKALLKEQNQQPSANGEPTNSAAPAQAYQQHFQPIESNTSPSWVSWFVIAILLLVIGLLGGFILGNQNAEQPQHYQPTLALPIETQAAVESPSSSQQTEQTQELTQPNLTAIEQIESSTNQTQESSTSNAAANEPREVDSATDENQNQLAQVTSDDEDQLVIKLDDLTKTDATLDDVPEDLQNKFAQVLEELNAEDIKNSEANNGNVSSDNAQERSSYIETSSTLPDINELEAVDRALLPAMTYEMHIYSSESRERWVRINNQTLYEGDKLTQNLKLVEIRQDSIIWETTYKRFSQEALSDYK